MEQDKCISLADSYIETEGDGNNVSQFIDDILRKNKTCINHKIIT